MMACMVIVRVLWLLFYILLGLKKEQIVFGFCSTEMEGRTSNPKAPGTARHLGFEVRVCGVFSGLTVGFRVASRKGTSML